MIKIDLKRKSKKIYILVDRLLNWLETNLYYENFYEADAERISLSIEVKKLQEEVEYLRDICSHMGIDFYTRH